MAGTLGILAEGDDAPLFFTLMNALEPADTALERIVNRLAELERPATDGTPAIATAADDFWPHTFEEWWRRLLRTTATAWTLTRTGLTA